jgi:hypothetical protein
VLHLLLALDLTTTRPPHTITTTILKRRRQCTLLTVDMDTVTVSTGHERRHHAFRALCIRSFIHTITTTLTIRLTMDIIECGKENGDVNWRDGGKLR